MTPEAPNINVALGVNRPLRRGRRVLLAVLVLALLGGGVALWRARTVEDPAAAYSTAPVERGDLTAVVTATGTVEPTNLVEISSELSGTIRSVDVDFNHEVKVGQVLAHLDTGKLEAAVAHGRATLEARRARIAEAEATVAETLAQLNRIRALAARDITSLQSLQTAEAAHARAEAGALVARADARVAEADLSLDEADLAKACICSPIDGVVLERNVDVGQIVASSLQAPVLFTIAEDLSQMELRVDIDEADMGVVRVGQTARFRVEAYQGRVFPAVISELRYAPQTIDGVVTYKAILSIDNADLLLRPGMTATAEIVVEEIRDALLVPNAALRFAPPAAPEATEGGGGGLLGLLIPRRPEERADQPQVGADGARTLWVLRDRRPIPVQVRTGATDGLTTVILEGDLAEGDLAVTEMAGRG